MVTEFVVKVVSTPHAPHSQPKKWSQCGVRCVHTTLHQLSGATPKIVKKVVCFPPPGQKWSKTPKWGGYHDPFSRWGLFLLENRGFHNMYGKFCSKLFPGFPDLEKVTNFFGGRFPVFLELQKVTTSAERSF